MAIHIGCGSWADDDYVGLLFPKTLAKTERLRAYTHWFDRIELNVGYHSTQPRDRMLKWIDQTPAGFIFDYKLHQAFSARPATTGEALDRMLASVQLLIDARRLGCLLLTLEPKFGPENRDLAEIDVLRKNLPPFPLAVELRHRGWIEGGARATTLEFFRQRQLSWVCLDLPPIRHPAILPAIDEVTNPAVAYFRLHGRNPNYASAKTAAERHHYDYTEEELTEIAGRIRAVAARAQEVHVSVNNHAANFAPKAALALRRMLGQRPRGFPLGHQGELF